MAQVAAPSSRRARRSPSSRCRPGRFNPSVEAGYLYDDNYRLTTPGTEIEVQGPLARCGARVARASRQPSEFSITPRVRATYFPDDYRARRRRLFRGRSTGSYQGQRVEHAGARRIRAAGHRQQRAARRRGAGGDLGEPDLGDSGRVLVADNRRTRYALRPSMSFDVVASAANCNSSRVHRREFRPGDPRRAGRLQPHRCCRRAADAAQRDSAR